MSRLSRGNKVNTQTLIERLGADYCTQRMNGTLFNHNGATYEFHEAGGKEVYCTKYTGTPEKPEVSTEMVPTSVFKDWNSLKWPTLGYRQAAGGQVIMLVGRKNSVQRGLHRQQLIPNVHPVTVACSAQFGLDYHYFRSGPALHLMVMQPSFTPFAEGLDAVMSGKVPAFAMSPDFAVAPNEQVDFLEILFRGRRVGTISESGNIKIEADSILPSWNKALI